jgi:hypothetical protein
MTGPGPDLAEHRHAELVEQLRRANAGLEALHRLGERQLSEMRNVTARMEGALQFVVRAWQEQRGRRRP